MVQQIYVTKADGSLEPLDYNKLRRALRRAGASGQMIDEIIDALSPRVRDGMPTSEIYRIAYSLLSTMRPGAAARFGLRNALLKLGPDGHPFETFIGALLKGRGYSTALRQTLQGRCISHEIDVVAQRGRYEGHEPTKCIIECKFHNSAHFECHIQSALYTWARFLDIRERNPDIKDAWLATNTKFSGDVVAYADCVGLRLLGWSFPPDESIQVRIDENKLYPTTILPHLDRRAFLALHEAGIITVKEFLATPDSELRKLKLGEREIERLKQEGKMVLSQRQ
ncbi:MAG: ATP cone domain-containing protein [Candidatus Micrarchaeota archaeon]|nr:ATP cone domain-containing protein [Candidatus Micrarchaeota archaeon]